MKNKLREMRNNKKGFTLIEMIVVIVIIAILVALAVPAVMGYVQDARDAKLRSAASAGATTIQTALAKDESLGKLDGPKLAEIITKGMTASGATEVLVCTDDIKSESVTCASAYSPTGAEGSNSLDDITRYIFKMEEKKYVIQPATGGGEAAIVTTK